MFITYISDRFLVPYILCNCFVNSISISVSDHGGDEVGLHEGEMGMEKERVIETLQLFPMKSGCEEGQKAWWRQTRKEKHASYSYALEKNYPPLELRLSTF